MAINTSNSTSTTTTRSAPTSSPTPTPRPETASPNDTSSSSHAGTDSVNLGDSQSDSVEESPSNALLDGLQENFSEASPTGASAETAAAEAAEEAPNPYGDLNYDSTNVTIDDWGTGPNDSIEGMLAGQGFSLSDIYSKDENGKTLVDHVMAANGIGNDRRIPSGTELQIPSRGENGAGISPQTLEEGETAEADLGDDVTIRAENNGEDGYTVASEDSRIQTESQAPGDRTRVSGSHDPETDTTETEQVLFNENGTPNMAVNTTTTPDQSEVRYRPLDGQPFDTVEIGPDGLAIDNGEAGNVTRYGDGNDGFFEVLGRNVDNGVGWLFGRDGGEEPEAIVLDGVRDLRVVENDEGVRVYADGQEHAYAGDSDDGWGERIGAGVDRAWDATTETVSGAWNATTDAVGGAWNAAGETISGAWSRLWGN